MEKKSPLPILVGVFTLLFAVLLIASQIEQIKNLFENLSYVAARWALVQLLLTYLLPISFGVVAIVAMKHNILILPVMLYVLINTLSYVFTYVAAGADVFKYFETYDWLMFAGSCCLLIALILSIVCLAVTKPFEENKKPQPQQQPQPEEQYYQQDNYDYQSDNNQNPNDPNNPNNY